MDLIRLYNNLGWCIWIGCLITGMNGQRDMDVNLVLSTPIKEGDDLKLKCLFSVPSNTSVSSVKWYKGSREIFRYEHKSNPKKQVIKFGNLTVDEGNSDMQTLKLKSVPYFMTGEMSCEVTLEDPSAKIVTKKANLLVVVPPKYKPKMDVSFTKIPYNQNIHQRLLANCTSAPSKPTANLTFYINESPILYDSPGVTLRSNLPDTTTSSTTMLNMNPNSNTNNVYNPNNINNNNYNANNNLDVRRIELEIDVNDQFVNGKVRLKCVSQLYNVHNISSDEFVGEDIRPRLQQHSQYSGNLYGRRSSATGIFNPSLTITGSMMIGNMVLMAFIQVFYYNY